MTKRMKKATAFKLVRILLLAVPIQALQAQNNPDLPPEATEFYAPVPPVIENPAHQIPSDAVVLFNGENLEAWQNKNDGKKAGWNMTDGQLVINPGNGDIQTVQSFGDVQVHLEWKSPEGNKEEGQHRGNSGVLLMGKYELQILDSYQNETYTNGQAASIYKQSPPLVNVTRPPGEWNSYDLIFKAPRFNKDGMLVKPASITVLHNGVLVQDNFILRGPTLYTGIPHYQVHPAKLPLVLQDHGQPVSFRNIWVRELE